MKLKKLLSIALFVVVAAQSASAQTSRVLHEEPYEYVVGDIASSAFSRDGKLFVSQTLPGEYDRIRVWDVASGKLIKSLSQKNLWDFTLSPDSRTVAIVSGQRGRYGVNAAFAIQLHDLKTGKFIRRILWPGQIRAAVYDVEFSPDGQRIAAGSGDGHIRIWSTKTGRLLRRLHQGGFINAVRFSPRGTQILTLATGRGGELKLWNVQTGRGLQAVALNSNVKSVHFSRDGKKIITNDSDDVIRTYNNHLKLLRTLPAPKSIPDDSSTEDVALSPNARRFAHVAGGEIYVRDLNSGSTLKRFKLSGWFQSYNTGVLAMRFISESQLQWVVFDYGEDNKYRIKLYNASF